MLKGFKKNQKGFTLVELLIVIAILGILVAIAIPAISGMTLTAKVGAANAELASVQTAMMGFYADEDGYPENSDALYPDYLSAKVKLVGKYTIGDSGVVTPVAVGGKYEYDGIEIFWDSANGKFVKTAP